MPDPTPNLLPPPSNPTTRTPPASPSSLSPQSPVLSPPLSHQQLSLALALTSQSPPPPGFDATRLSLAAEMLLAKRISSAAKSWPPLADLLGPTFRPLFTTYAQSHPLSPGATPADDAFHFAEHLASLHQLPLPALRLLSHAQLRRHPRRFLLIHRTPHLPGLLLTFPLPFLGPRSLHLPLPRQLIR